jgi:RNA polymerase sigma-70 factor (ECF subfamily)
MLNQLFWSAAQKSGPDVEEALQVLIAEGRGAWPELALDDELFVRHLARHFADDPGTLAGARGEELFLACACANRVPGAVEAFEREYLSGIAVFVARVDNSAPFLDEIRQLLREKLLVDGEQPARIGGYSGRGALESWVRVSAVHTALNQRRRRREEVHDSGDAAERALAVGPDPEIDYIKDRYKGDFKDAFEAALASLSAKERNLLRLHFVNGLNIDKIGALNHVHRATVARWIAAARQKLLAETRRLMNERLQLSPTEFASLAGLVRSQLDLSIVRVLKDSQDS